MASKRVNIIGPGSIGHLIGCFLSKLSDIRFYTHRYKRNRTISLHSPRINENFDLSYFDFEHWQNCDLIIISVKAFQLEEVCKKLVQIKAKQCPVILMMNGMGLVEIVARYLPQWPVSHAYLTHGAFISGNELIHAGLGEISLGSLNETDNEDDLPDEQFSPYVKLINDVLPPANWQNQHKSKMLLKLIINAIINPLTAISKQTNGNILSKGKLNAQASALLNEMRPLFEHLPLQMTFEQITRNIEQVALNTSENQSSMLQDILKGRPTEIDFINGYLKTLADRYSIEMPINNDLINKIKVIENSFTKPT